MRSYLKKKVKKVEIEALTEKLETVQLRCNGFKKVVFAIIAVVLATPVVLFGLAQKEFENVTLSEVESVQLVGTPIAATASKGVISIPRGTVKANPFLPYRDIEGVAAVDDVPSVDIVAPPEMINENSDAARVMDTIVSGILYDKFSPSAILNIEGSDYLVKKGDVVNNYKVVSIMQDSVTVQLGENIYKAGIGQILTEGSLNHNDVSNLSNKFGGVK